MMMMMMMTIINWKRFVVAKKLVVDTKVRVLMFMVRVYCTGNDYIRLAAAGCGANSNVCLLLLIMS